jgi:phosphohistidine phosphatase SixA
MRHASAGERLPSPTEDRARSLDRVGLEDARALIGMLMGYEIDRIVTSPHARCRETAEPIAQARGLDVECREALAPDGSRHDILNLLRELPDSALVSTHREAFEQLFGGDIRCEKGGFWRVEVRDDGIVPLEYVPPASSAARKRPRARRVRT